MDDFEKRLADAKVELEQKEASQSAHTQKAIWDSVLSIFDTALKLWASKEKTKYIDKKMSLMREWNEEYNRADRSRLNLDRIEFELRVLQLAFIHAASESGNAP